MTQSEAYKYNLTSPTSIHSAEVFGTKKALDIIKQVVAPNKKNAIYTDSLSAIQNLSGLCPKNRTIQEIQETL